MSQVFSGDCVQGGNAASIPTSGETAVLTGNFLNPPFQNAKAVVTASIALTVGAGTTGLTLRIRRNPAAENLSVAGSGPISVTAGNNAILSFQAADAIPDGRAVQYAITVQPAGATGAGTVVVATISTFLISG